MHGLRGPSHKLRDLAGRVLQKSTFRQIRSGTDYLKNVSFIHTFMTISALVIVGHRWQRMDHLSR